MKPGTREHKELFKKMYHARLDKAARDAMDAAWEVAFARCREVLADIFTELLMDEMLAAAGSNGSTVDGVQQAVQNREAYSPRGESPPGLMPPGSQPPTLQPPRPGTEQHKPVGAGDRQPEEQPASGESDSGPSRRVELRDGESETGASAPKTALVYLYCLAPGGAELLFNDEIVPGIPDGGRVQGIRCGGLSAVVSSVPAEVYNEDALAGVVQDPAWLESRVTAHEQVIQFVMKNFPVIPMKFCTIFNDVERVKQVLAEREDEFNRALAYVEGKEEWGLKVYYKPGILSGYVENTSERIREAREKAAAGGAGAAYFMRKKMDELIAEEMANTAAGLVGRVHDELARYAVDSRLNRLLSGEVTGRVETMALNAVYFVERHALTRFKEAEAELSSCYRDRGFEFVLTGPWPPYNFTSPGSLEGGGEHE